MRLVARKCFAEVGTYAFTDILRLSDIYQLISGIVVFVNARMLTE